MPKNIVVLGGGIIGSTTAYFLSHHPSFLRSTHTITLLEATSIASGASGKAGGLLALWAYPECIVPLSFSLHAELAQQHDGEQRWGYRRVNVAQIAARVQNAKTKETAVTQGKEDGLNGQRDSVSLEKRKGEKEGLLKSKGVPKELDWVDGEVLRGYEEMSDTSQSAQVHPRLFTKAMAELAEEKGVKIIFGSARSVNKNAGGDVASVTYTEKESGDEKVLEADTVVLAAGPWSPTIIKGVPVSALRAHSVTIQPSREVSNYCLFTGIDMPRGLSARRSTHVTPEIYARPDNEVYACGEGDTLVPLPKTSDLVQCDESRCDEIVEQVTAISEELRHGKVLVKQACYLPNVSAGGGPLIGPAPDVKGLFIATGHTCWGIQNAPGTSKVLSEMIWDGEAKSANVKKLDPGRYM